MEASGGSSDIPQTDQGYIQWATTFGTRKVTQDYEVDYAPTGEVDIAYGNQRLGVTFRFALTNTGIVLVSAIKINGSNHIVKCVSNC